MNPMIEFIGVRSSCDMLARNSLLARLARSASCRAISRRRRLRPGGRRRRRSRCCSTWKPFIRIASCASAAVTNALLRPSSGAVWAVTSAPRHRPR